MRDLLFAFTLATGTLIVPWTTAQADAPARASVTHISSEHAYIDVGTANGLAVGDTLEVWRDERRVGIAITVFVARHSAACRPFSGPPIQPGDVIVPRIVGDSRRAPDTTAPPGLERAPKSPPAERSVRSKGRSLGRVHGALSMQWYRARVGDDEARVEIDEPTARLTLGARRLFDQNLDVRVRVRLRRDQGTRLGDDDAAWRDRVYELTVAYASTGGGTTVHMGRIAPRAVSGMGYVDGVTLSQAITPHTRVGLVGGRRVSWATDGSEPIIEKYGVFVESSREGSARLTGTLAAVAEYQAGDIHREYVSARVGYRRGVLDLSQLGEVDVNRGWRNDRAESRFTLARVRSSLRLRPSRSIRMSVSYDSTERTWTTLNRSVPDSLFDDALRRGLRASTDLEPVAGLALRLGAGIRGREGEAATRSWEAGLGLRRLPIERLGVHLRATGFDGDFARGLRPEARVDYRTRTGHRLELAAGRYTYETDFSEEPRVNEWVRGETSLRLSPLTLRASLEIDRGDDAPGHRVLSEITYHF